ncbi:hypothetical protein ACJJJB_00260 (plasmid) [Microbulbifer sp. ANSA001]|uniref:hypothetical protein n=1 Tax=Microbulbifer sp. ANSA001 TaxID=3243358 RepID=UPI00404134EC
MEVSKVDKVRGVLGFLASRLAEERPGDAAHIRYLCIEAEDALGEISSPPEGAAVVGLEGGRRA